MNNFKITNLKSKVVQYMNESEKKQFFTKNSLGDYKWEYTKKNTIIENIIFYALSFLASFTLLYLLCYTLTLIDKITL